MRPLTEQQQRLLKHPAGCTVRGRVRILGPDGAWHDLSNLFGRDFLEGMDVDESLDTPVGQATVRLQREVRGLSLAPLMLSSLANNLGAGYAPLVDPNRLFRVEVALGPPRELPTSPQWLPLFFGRIDSVDAGAPDVLTFTGRDMAGVLQDVWTAEEATLGSDAGIPLEVVCDDILSDAQLSDFALYVPEASTQALGKYKQDYEPCMDALQKLAAGRGWEVRWKYRPDTGDWGLWLWGPDRAATAAAWTYSASDYEYLGELRVGLEDVRTAVEVVYSDASDLDAAGQPKRKTVRRESATALARYGYLTSGGTRLHRFMRVTEGATSNIRSATEAGRLADSALADLSTTDVGASVDVGLHPGLELGDLVALSANGLNFSADQALAVRGVTHRLSSTSARTSLRLLGKPSLGPRTWLSMESRPGLAPGSPFTGPAAPSGLSVTSSLSGAVLLFTAPSVTSGGPPAEEYELHVGSSPGFTLSSATLKAVSSSTRFDLTGLTAGASLYARVRSRDRKGNVGPASAEVALAPRYVEPRLLQPRVTYAALPLNSDFEAANDVDGRPDAWDLTGTWGVDASTTAEAYTGGRALIILGATTTATSQAMAVRQGVRYYADTVARTTSTSIVPQVSLQWLSVAPDGSLAVIGIDNVTLGASIAANTYTRMFGVAVAPTGAKFVQVVLSRTPTGSGAVTFDSVAFGAADAVTEAPVFPSAVTYLGGRTPYTTGGRLGISYRKDNGGTVSIEGNCTAGVDGTSIYQLPPGYWPPATRDFTVRTGSGTAHIQVTASGALTVLTGATGATWLSMQGVSYRAA